MEDMRVMEYLKEKEVRGGREGRRMDGVREEGKEGRGREGGRGREREGRREGGRVREEGGGEGPGPHLSYLLFSPVAS